MLGLLAAGLIVTATVPATTAVDVVTSAIGRAVTVTENAALPAAERRRELMAVADGLLDFDDMSRRAFGKHWVNMTAAERAEFTALFRRLLAFLFLRTVEGYSGARIAYLDSPQNGALATVNTEIRPARGASMRVSYRLARRSDRWSVYDVVVDGVSVVSNYRSQFDQAIRSESRSALMEAMREADRDISTPRDGKSTR